MSALDVKRTLSSYSKLRDSFANGISNGLEKLKNFTIERKAKFRTEKYYI